MASPYVGEIRLVAFNFAPAGWAFCDGQLLPISQYETLFNLIGTTYGGDGQSTFALPDLRGRVPVHMGNGYVIGQPGGVEQVTLTASQIPAHAHQALCSTAAPTTASPAGAVWAADSGTDTPYKSGGPAGVSMRAGAIGNAGGGQPHENRQPFLCINYVISFFGIFPSQT
jgi:microcystin-dependent protein